MKPDMKLIAEWAEHNPSLNEYGVFILDKNPPLDIYKQPLFQSIRYDPLTDDAQAFELLKHGQMGISYLQHSRCWRAFVPEWRFGRQKVGEGSTPNEAIVNAVWELIKEKG